MEKKLTKKDYFEIIKGVCADRQDIIEFCDKEIALLAKKNSKSNSKAQELNKEIANLILNELAKIERPISLTDLINTSEVIKNYTYIVKEGGVETTKYLTTQKITPILTSLIKSGQVVRTDDKKKSYYSIGN